MDIPLRVPITDLLKDRALSERLQELRWNAVVQSGTPPNKFDLIDGSGNYIGTFTEDGAWHHIRWYELVTGSS